MYSDLLLQMAAFVAMAASVYAAWRLRCWLISCVPENLRERRFCTICPEELEWQNTREGVSRRSGNRRRREAGGPVFTNFL